MADNFFTEVKFPVGATELKVLKAGTGKPLLVFHGELGFPGPAKWMTALAEKRTLHIPLHPGYGKTPQANWIMDMRDLGNFYARFIREQKLAPVDVIGFSLGGWLAAEMATANSAQFGKMVLVGAAGLRPPSGEIMDMFTLTARNYLNANVADIHNAGDFSAMFGGEQTPTQYEEWEEARAETARIAWQPYMFTQSMANLLENVVGLPTLLVWGKQDKVVPLSVAELYKKQIAGAKLVTIDKCGHMPEVEQSAEFVKEVSAFLG
ncbi:MAG: alpha/beta hydrolase [Candidatus Binataceae bacterium]|nr:alpha/beta hydrolase [Candidatus Binataceae bacterium]